MTNRDDEYPLMIMEPGSTSKNDAFMLSSSRPPERSLGVSKRLIALVIFLGILTIVVVVLQFCFEAHLSEQKNASSCQKSTVVPNCTVTLVESIPEDVTFPNGSIVNPTIYSGWMDLLKIAKKEIDIASFYWTMRGSDTNTTDASTKQGEEVFASLEATAKRGVKIRIVQTPPSKTFPSLDTIELQKKGLAEVRWLDMEHLLGAGILHTKMWLVDGQHFFVGSANQDWRALTQVQELGFMTYNCSCLADDLGKIFDVYWLLAQKDAKIPDPWPKKYETSINADSPAKIKINGSYEGSLFFSSSPNALCPPGRAEDLATIIRIIDDAKEFVYVSVMDYFPTTLYTHSRTYWPDIDDALRRAAFDRKVRVRLLASEWESTRPDMKLYLRSLAALNTANNASVEVKLYKVPPYTIQIDYARVNHNKFMVTDRVAYVGTSNWSADYFLNTAGVGYVVNETEAVSTADQMTLRANLQAVFERNWNSSYTTPVSC